MSQSTQLAELAIFGGQPARPRPVPVCVPPSDELKQAIAAFLDSGEPLGTYYGGTHTRRFESAFAAAHGHDRHAVATNSGTSALHLALVAAGVGPGDEVIVSAFSFVSAASAVVQLGAIPVFCDAEPVSLTMDVRCAESLVTERTKAILPVHYWGYPADLPALRTLCDAYHLTLVEDAAQAPLAPAGDRMTGAYGEFAAYAFCDRKHLSTGEGGMVLCATAAAADRVRSLANFGKSPEWDEYHELGYSYRMVELSAIIGLDRLSALAGEQQARRSAAAQYVTALADTSLHPVPDPPWGQSIYFKLPILLPAGHSADRGFVVSAVAAENVSCRIPHRPLYDIEWLAEYTRNHGRYAGARQCPVTADAFARMIEVETGPNLPAAEAAKSAAAVAKVWRSVTGGPRA